MIRVNDLHDVEWREGITVQDVLDALGWDYVLIVVTINGATVDPDTFDTTPVPDGADMRAIHIAHGG